MNDAEMKELLTKLGEAPVGMAEPEVAAECAAMAENGFTAAEVKSLLDRIVFAALAADVFVTALDIVWKAKLEAEAQSHPNPSLGARDPDELTKDNDIT